MQWSWCEGCHKLKHVGRGVVLTRGKKAFATTERTMSTDTLLSVVLGSSLW
mgnify:CR=1 FL=1